MFSESHVGIEFRWSVLEVFYLRRDLETFIQTGRSRYGLLGFRWHIPIGDWRLDDPLPEPATTTVLPSLKRHHPSLGCLWIAAVAAWWGVTAGR